MQSPGYARSRRRRRWPQFSLRTLLILFTLVAVAVPIVHRWVRYQRAVERLESLGAYMTYHSPEHDTIWFTQWLKLHISQAYIDDVLYVSIQRHVDDRDLVHLTEFDRLEYLSLRTSQTTDAGLVHVRQLQSLRSLWLWQVPVTDRGLAQLQGMSSLETLGLHGTSITDAGLVHLAGMQSLKYLNLGGTRVTAEGVQQLQEQLPNCTIVY